MVERTLSPMMIAAVVCTSFAVAVPAFAADVTVRLDAGSRFSILSNTGTANLRVEGDTGNITRNNALFLQTTSNNTFLGTTAGNTATTGMAADGWT